MFCMFYLYNFSVKCIIKNFYFLPDSPLKLNKNSINPHRTSWTTSKTSCNTRKTLWNTQTLTIWCGHVCAQCGNIGSWRFDIRDCGVCKTPKICNRVTNPWDEFFSKLGVHHTHWHSGFEITILAYFNFKNLN